jgi:hypothetical protein
MENLLLILATSFVLRLSTSKKFRNSFIGNTGCSVLLISDDNFEKTITASGDELYFYEASDNNVTYGIICVNMKEACAPGMAIDMLEDYINKLKAPLFILHHTGIAADADWNSSESRAVTDYWQDSNKVDWKVKGYTNGECLAVLYVKNIGQVDVKKQDLFLDSFHFRPAC